MTREEFESAKFGVNTKVVFRGKEYDVVSVDFDEGLVAIDEFPDWDDEALQYSWKRCENIEISEW